MSDDAPQRAEDGVVTTYRIRDAAALLAVSDDTVRRLVDDGRLVARLDASGRRVVDGASLAHYAQSRHTAPEDVLGVGSSARNRLTGLVTAVRADGVMAEVQLQCGPFRMISLMSAESAQQLGLRPGSLAVAVVKSTMVIIETPAGQT